MAETAPSGQASARTHVDVIVIGGGGAGLAAASTAAELGRRVVLLEKEPQLGGSTAWSVGSVSATCTPHQIRQGIKDYPEHHHEDLKLFAGAQAERDNFELARVLTRHSPEMFRWLLSAGLEFVGPFPEPPHRRARMHNVLPNSRAFPFHLGRLCRKHGVQIELRTRAERLHLNEQGAHTVVARTADGILREFVAANGVVLAGGDFSASPELKARFASEALAAVTAVNEAATGDGIRLGLECGGSVVNGDMVRGPILRFVPPPERALIHRLPPQRLVTRAMRFAFDHVPQALLRPALMRFLTTALAPERSLYAHGTILVDRGGERFADERKRPEQAAALRPEGMAYLVFDHAIAARYDTWPNYISTAPSVGYAYLEDYRRTRPDIFHRAGTLEALAASMGVPAAVFAHTIARYNAGESPSGVAPRADRPALSKPPYYALGPAKAYVIFTNGGLKVTPRLEVVGAAGNIIPGLYAAGSNGQGGMLLEGHGHHLGWAFVSGRIAGRNAALLDRGYDQPNPSGA
ncbi:MAG: FAD-dependent oxidoreductase [Burkholderiales bacterium]|nr:FAD-dependent oxidoreductase [Burkholderiales bacterium]